MRSSRPIYAAVMLGSAAGATARYAISLAALHLPIAWFPWGTLLANVTGSFAIGFVATVTARTEVRPVTRQFVMVGVLGGFTTFSVFSLESVLLVLGGHVLAASVYVAAAVLSWVPAAWAGHVLARRSRPSTA